MAFGTYRQLSEYVGKTFLRTLERLRTGSSSSTAPTAADHPRLLTETTGQAIADEMEANLQNKANASEIGIVVEGNKTTQGADEGQYIILRNSTITGCADGLYTAAKAIPYNTAIDSTYLTAVSGGGLNALNASFLQLVWTNTNAYSQSFPAQTITFSSNANSFLIEFITDNATSASARCRTYNIIGLDDTTSKIDVIGHRYSDRMEVLRRLDITKNNNTVSIAFSDGKFFDDGTTENGWMRPYRIYAMK